MKLPTSREVAPLAGGLGGFLFGLALQHASDRNQEEAQNLNEILRAIEESRIQPALDAARHTHVPVMTRDAGNPPPGLDEGMVRLAFDIGVRLAETELEKDAYNFGATARLLRAGGELGPGFTQRAGKALQGGLGSLQKGMGHAAQGARGAIQQGVGAAQQGIGQIAQKAQGALQAPATKRLLNAEQQMGQAGQLAQGASHQAPAAMPATPMSPAGSSAPIQAPPSGGGGQPSGVLKKWLGGGMGLGANLALGAGVIGAGALGTKALGGIKRFGESGDSRPTVYGANSPQLPYSVNQYGAPQQGPMI